jgi:hypothetical protein
MLKPNEWKSSLDVALKDHSTQKDCSSRCFQSAPRKVSDSSSVVWFGRRPLTNVL